MTDYCASRNQIKTYAPATASNTLFAKNIDCVSLDADLVACDTLTVQGVDLSGYTDVLQKTQYQTASANNTTFTGGITTSALTVSQINGVTAGNGVQVTSIVDQSYNNAAGGINLYLINSSLGTATNSQTMGLRMGTSKIATNSGWDMLYVNAGSGLVSNRLDFKMSGQTTPTLSLINGLVGINKTSPTEALDVTGNVKISGTLTLTSQPTFPAGINPNRVYITGNSGTSTVTLTGINTTAQRYKIILYKIGSSVNPIVSLRLGSATTGYQASAFTYTNLLATGIDFQSVYAPVNGRALGNGSLLSGTIFVDRVLSPVNTFAQFVLSGTTFQSNSTGSEYAVNYVSGTLTTTTTTAAISQISLNHSYDVGTFNSSTSFICCEWY